MDTKDWLNRNNYLARDTDTHACNCVGPQDGQPLCPCRMKGVNIINGRYVQPAVDLGPVRVMHNRTWNTDDN